MQLATRSSWILSSFACAPPPPLLSPSRSPDFATFFPLFFLFTVFSFFLLPIPRAKFRGRIFFRPSTFSKRIFGIRWESGASRTVKWFISEHRFIVAFSSLFLPLSLFFFFLQKFPALYNFSTSSYCQAYRINVQLIYLFIRLLISSNLFSSFFSFLSLFESREWKDKYPSLPKLEYTLMRLIRRSKEIPDSTVRLPLSKMQFRNSPIE